MVHFPIKNGDFPVRKLLVYPRLCLPSLRGARQAIQGPSQALQLRVLHGLGAAPRGELNVEPERTESGWSSREMYILTTIPMRSQWGGYILPRLMVYEYEWDIISINGYIKINGMYTYIQCEAPKIDKVVYNSNVTMVYGTYNELVTGANLKQQT